MHARLKLVNLIFIVLAFLTIAVDGDSSHLFKVDDGTNDDQSIHVWAVEIDGGNSVADEVAKQHDLINIGPIGGLPNYFNFVKVLRQGRAKRSVPTEPSRLTKRLERDGRVAWVSKQERLRRTKRDFTVVDSKIYQQNSKSTKINWTSNQSQDTQSTEDPLWKKQWYMNPYQPKQKDQPSILKIVPVWKKNITGRGVVVAVIDDGLEWRHSDLVMNYDSDASTDLNGYDRDPSPDKEGGNAHGTRCAGEIAMAANNSLCGVGVAFNARIGGIRMLDGFVGDSIEAAALSFNYSHIDIYSCSWGPTDDGRTMEKPDKLTQAAIETSVAKGRGGKGSLIVWAAGNGGLDDDNCNFDGYASSPYVFTISSVARDGIRPAYSERCAAIIAATFSSGNNEESRIVSTDVNNGCTDNHGGTSAAAPLAAGIFALLLERNPNLSWRDVKHIIAWTADYESLKTNFEWMKNGAGFWLNEGLGFGLLDADAMVTIADPATWVSVGRESICTIPVISHDTPRNISSENPLKIEVVADGCKGSLDEVNYLELVVLELSMKYSHRGGLSIGLLSPSNAETILLYPRKYDDANFEINDWHISSVHNWGESPVGTWTVDLFDKSEKMNAGQVMSMKLIFRGTKDIPPLRQRFGPKRNYSKTSTE